MKTALACALLLLAAPALADGSIVGVVTALDSRQPVANVTVRVTSPQMQGEKTVVTDAEGRYRVDQLPVGSYTVRFESEFNPYARSDISVRLHRTLRVDAELLEGVWIWE